MKTINARIKRYGIRVSDRYYDSLELFLELELEGSGGVVFAVWGPWSENFEKNMFAYSLKKVMDIAGVDDVEKLTGAPIRAIFDAPEDEESMLGRMIIGIKHFLKNDSFIPREDPMYEDVNNVDTNR